MKTKLCIATTLVALMAATSHAVELKAPNFETPALESYYSGQAASISVRTVSRSAAPLM